VFLPVAQIRSSADLYAVNVPRLSSVIKVLGRAYKDRQLGNALLSCFRFGLRVVVDAIYKRLIRYSGIVKLGEAWLKNQKIKM
jgi:hypothetical protein